MLFPIEKDKVLFQLRLHKSMLERVEGRLEAAALDKGKSFSHAMRLIECRSMIERLGLMIEATRLTEGDVLVSDEDLWIFSNKEIMSYDDSPEV